MSGVPYKARYGFWIVDCPECGYTSPCQVCEGSGEIDAMLDDFDGLTVKLNTGETVYIENDMFWSMDGDELRQADIASIAAVLERVT